MGGIPNGRLDESTMVNLGSGWDKYGQWFHLAPPGTAARWQELVRLAHEKYGVRLRVTPGWNIYRPLRIQYLYRADLGIWAAVPGTSSHGGEYQGRECCAIDVQNWGDLGWARFVALCRIVGLTVNFVKPQELWHVGDFNPWTVPQFAAINIKPLPIIQPEPEEDEMGFYYGPTDGSKPFMFFNQARGKSRSISSAEWSMLRAFQRGAAPVLPMDVHMVSTYWYDEAVRLGTY
jgi:hypothetical protein